MLEKGNFLDKYMLYTKGLESPDSYHIWCCLSAVASCLRRQVWVDMGYFRYYPNMYIVLVGPPGCRKNAAINAAMNLVQGIPEVTFSSDSITREALIQYIKRHQRIINMDDSGMNLYTHASVTIVSKELSVFLGTHNFEFLSLLTDLYDCPDTWEYRTKGKGTDTIENVWLNMLAATTPTWLVGSIPLSFIGGGFTSRVIFVVEDGVRYKVPRPVLGEREASLQEELRVDLERISTLRGEFRFTKEAGKWFDDWYIYENIPTPGTKLEGYFDRKHAQLLKAAMNLSACEGDSMVLEVRHLEMARDLLDRIEPKMFRAFGGAGRSPIAADIDEIMRSIMRAGIIERSQLMKATLMDVHIKEFDLIVSTLKTTGWIREKVINGKLFYEYIGGENEDESRELPR